VKGFGLGLSYVKAVMQQHGAEIDVVSTVGEGSTFTLVFPLNQKTS
jgi:two-component system phosphate regulon sensor histidine kinase PhoR